MTWLHDWSGLVIGWLLFAIALAGSLSVFRPEIDNWTRPEASCCVTDTADSGAAAMTWLAANAAGAPAWYIRPADARARTSYAGWADPAHPPFTQKWLDARMGSPLKIRDTLGGEFFYRLHFELQLPYPWGRMLSGSAALLMLLAIITGIVAHRRIFVDFFTFRPSKGQRSWLDAHNLLAVVALPFHIIITFTGALTLANLLMPWGFAAAYPGEPGGHFRDLNPEAITRPTAGRPAPLGSATAILHDAQRRFGGDIAQITVTNPGDANAVVSVMRAEDARIGIQAQSLDYDGVTGKLLSIHDESRPAVATFNILYGLHTARFAEIALRWLYFLSGLGLTALIGTGLLLWTAKRRQKRRDAGFALVERLNIGFIGGTPIAFATYFLANRLLPLDISNRADWEVRSVFWTWGALLLFAACRKPDRAWREILVLAAASLAAIPLVDGLAAWPPTSGRLGLDLTALIAAAGYTVAARRHFRASPPATRRPRPATTLAS